MPHKSEFRKYVKEMGFCCPWAFLATYRTKYTSVLAEDTGLTTRAIRYWRQDYRKGKLKCEECPRCLKLTLTTGRIR